MTVPRHFLKEIIPSIGQSVLAIIDDTLSSGVVPQSFKHAVVQPLLKKPGFDFGLLAHLQAAFYLKNPGKSCSCSVKVISR